MWQDADVVARDAYDAVMRGRIVRIPGRANRGLSVLARLLPDSLVTAVVRRQGRKFRAVGDGQRSGPAARVPDNDRGSS
jgi:short-subunit dehydrogenase